MNFTQQCLALLVLAAPAMACRSNDAAPPTPFPSAAPSPPAAPPPPPTLTETVVIDARTGWQINQTPVRTGDAVRYTARGQWSVAPSWGLIGPGGYAQAARNPSTLPAPNGRVGQLLARSRGYSVLNMLNSDGQFLADQDGVLEFRINDGDDSLSDNQGAVTVNLTITRAP